MRKVCHQQNRNLLLKGRSSIILQQWHQLFLYLINDLENMTLKPQLIQSLDDEETLKGDSLRHLLLEALLP